LQSEENNYSVLINNKPLFPGTAAFFIENDGYFGSTIKKLIGGQAPINLEGRCPQRPIRVKDSTGGERIRNRSRVKGRLGKYENQASSFGGSATNKPSTQRLATRHPAPSTVVLYMTHTLICLTFDYFYDRIPVNENLFILLRPQRTTQSPIFSFCLDVNVFDWREI